jgi:hypothetical protein
MYTGTYYQGVVEKTEREGADDQYNEPLNINPKCGHIKVSADDDILAKIKRDVQLAIIRDGSYENKKEIYETDPCYEVINGLKLSNV